MKENHSDTNFLNAKPYRIALVLLAAIAVVIIIHRIPGCESDRTYVVRTITIQVDSLSQIELLSDSLVKPILYSHVYGLDQLDTRRAKDIFISVLLPGILVAKHNVKQDSLKILRLTEKEKWKPADSTFYHELKTRYKATTPETLLSRMISLPNSIVLAQAAIETGWGQSRFFLEGNNVFGIWSFNPEEPRLQASISREVPVYVRAYDNISESIQDYFETLGSARAYQSLRQARMETNDPFELIPHLKYYSERRSWYTNQLKIMIVNNNLTQYDHYQIDPGYLVPE